VTAGLDASRRSPRDAEPHAARSARDRSGLTHHAVLGLGSNLGDRLETLQRAVDTLADTPLVEVSAVSPVYETDPVGGPDQADYLNAVVVVETGLSASALLDRAGAVEQTLHRVRLERWGPRTIDVDIIVYDQVVMNEPTLTIPHPRAHERGFVLRPWHDVEPSAVIPGRGSVAHLLGDADRAGVRPRPDLRLSVPG